MSEKVDIEIGIRVVTEELEKAVQLLEKMDQVLRRYQTSIAQAGPATSGLVKDLKEVAPTVHRDVDAIDKFIGGLDLATETQDEFRESIRLAAQEEFPFDKVWTATRKFGESLGLTTRQVDTMVKHQKRLMKDAETSTTRALRKMDQEYYVYRSGVRAIQAALGPTAYAVRMLSMQFYWLGIGIMFVAMSYSRLQAAQLKAKQVTLSLARAHRSLEDAQKSLTRSIIEYGAGSEEAVNAAKDFIETEKSLELQRESARQALIQEKTAWVSFYLGAIPIGINILRSAIDIYAVGVGLSKHAAFVKSREASAELLLGKANIVGFFAKVKNFIATKLGIGASNQKALALAREEAGVVTLTGAETGLNIVRGIGLALATMGVGVAISLAAAFAVQSVIMGQVESEMSKLNAESESFYNNVDDLAGELGDLTDLMADYVITIRKVTDEEKKLGKALEDTEDSAESLEEEIGPHSLRGSFLQVMDTFRELRMELSRPLTFTYEDLEIRQKVIQELIPIEIPEVMDKEQYINQVLNQVRIPSIDNIEQVITQELDRIDIPVTEDIIQIIKQTLEEVSYTEPEELTQNIIQHLESVNIPVPEEMYQNIVQRLEEAEHVTPFDITQRIIQVVEEAVIPSPDMLYQSIVQRLEPFKEEGIIEGERIIKQVLMPIDIPGIEEGEQVIRRELEDVVIPPIEDIRQMITQTLVPVEEFPDIEDITQNINQILHEAEIQTIRDLEQRITQILIEADIPVLEDEVQVITQNIIKSAIEEPEDYEQTITQVLNEVNIEVQDSLVQTITQELEEVSIPVINDITQTIIQRIEEASVTSPEDMTQIIEQVLLGVKIPVIEDVIQRITQVLEETEHETPEELTQDIIQVLHEASIPGIEDIDQRIVQTLIETEVKEPEDIDQIITRVLIDAQYPEIEDITQRIVQELIPVIFNKPEDMTQDIIQRLVGVNIPRIYDQTQYIIQEIIKSESEEPEDLTQLIIQKVSVPEELESIRREEITLKTDNIVPLSNGRNNIVMNISFPNLIIREEADIQKIAYAIDNLFQSQYYSQGGGLYT